MSTEETEPKGSTSSSKDECVEASHCFQHAERCCHCGKLKDSLPRGEPKGSASSSPLDPHCQCGHWRLSHGSGRGSCITCPCDAYKPEKPQEPTGCEHVPYFGEPHQQPDSRWWQVSICKLCKVTLPGTHAVHDPCTHCEGPHALKDCKGLEEPEEGGCAHCGEAHHWTDCKDYEDLVESTPPPRRPPYAVAYAVEGGALYEVAVSGDATVVAEDGCLQVLHPKRPVLAIVRVTPMNMEES